jgi:phosphatidylserine/phosphatidylglycerophosphate/cardiolipin synthase-like enzyme
VLAQTRARLIVVAPRFLDQAGRASLPPNLVARKPGLRLLRSAGGPRFAVCGLVNDAGIPIDVHAKVCLIDDTWGCVGSDTANRRSWTHDSELSWAVLDTDTGTDRDVQAGRSWAEALRLQLSAEHLGDAAPRRTSPIPCMPSEGSSCSAGTVCCRRGRRRC